MDINDLFRRLRQQGLRSKEAASVTGYALLARQIGWDALPVSHHHRRKIQRTLAKLDVDSHDVRFDAPAPEENHPRRWSAEGVQHSGGAS